MGRFQDQKVLITGAGSGIGRETALAFAREGAFVIATDIGEKGLAGTAQRIQSAGGRCETHGVDVSNEAAMRALAERVHKVHGALDVLVNNAGIAVAGRFLETPLDASQRVVDVNLRGVLIGCHVFLPPMVARGRGHVVNTASMAGYFPTPDLPVYTATKFAVLGFSEALRGDLKSRGIGVSAICPGVINTNIVQASPVYGDAAKWKDKGVDFYQKRNYRPEKVAAAILKAVRCDIAVLPVTPEAWVFYYLKRFLPALTRWLASQPLPFMKGK